jgi:hypothetical protein
MVKLQWLEIGGFAFRDGLSWLRRWALVRAFVGSLRHRDRLSCLASHLQYKGTKYFSNYQIFTHFFLSFSLNIFATQKQGKSLSKKVTCRQEAIYDAYTMARS